VFFRRAKSASIVQKTPQKQGGIVFFIALIALAVLFSLTVRIFFSQLSIWDWYKQISLLLGILVGAYIARAIVRGRFGVFIHELKHSVVSNLSGNRAKEMKVEKDHGYFRYEYTNHTAHMNAFINIAPYVFPLFSLVFMGLSACFLISDSYLTVFIVGMGFGIDVYAHARDLGPHQSDLQLLKGGYTVGVSFVLLANAWVFFLLLFFSNAGWKGFHLLFTDMLKIFFYLGRIFI